MANSIATGVAYQDPQLNLVDGAVVRIGHGYRYVDGSHVFVVLGKVVGGSNGHIGFTFNAHVIKAPCPGSGD